MFFFDFDILRKYVDKNKLKDVIKYIVKAN